MYCLIPILAFKGRFFSFCFAFKNILYASDVAIFLEYPFYCNEALAFSCFSRVKHSINERGICFHCTKACTTIKHDVFATV